MKKNKKTPYPKEWDKQTIQVILKDLDHTFFLKNKKVEIIAIGGVAIVLQDYQDRSTNDIDIAPLSGSEYFLRTCEELGIKAQSITLATTVDFNDTEKVLLFKGNALTVFSVTAEGLIRLKLERFRKQDPEDIYAIIQKEKLSYEDFVKLVKEGLSYFVGRVETYQISAQIVVETIYPDHIDDFKKRLR